MTNDERMTKVCCLSFVFYHLYFITDDKRQKTDSRLTTDHITTRYNRQDIEMNFENSNIGIKQMAKEDRQTKLEKKTQGQQNKGQETGDLVYM